MKRINQSGLTRFIKNRLDKDTKQLYSSMEKKYNIKPDEVIEVIKNQYSYAPIIYETTFFDEVCRVRLSN